MKKLNKIISPEIDKKGQKVDGFNPSPNKLEKKQLKIQQKTKNENRMLSSKINNLLNLINTNGLNNLDDQSYIDISNKSVHLKGKSSVYYQRKYSKNLINDNQINKTRKNSFCVRNHNDLFIQKIYKKQTTISNQFLKKKKDLIDLSNKTFHSNKKLDLSSNLNGIANTHFETNNKLTCYLNSNINSNLNSNLNSNVNSNSNIHETNSLYLNTDINSNKSIKYTIKTPKLLESANNSQEKCNKNTNAFSTTNENNTLTSRARADNEKSKISTKFKVKEFILNSNSKNKFNQSSRKPSQYSSSNKINKIEKNEKKFPFEFRISSPKRLFKNNEEKKKFVNKIFKTFNAGEYKNAEKDIKIYLSEIKEVNPNDIKDIISRYTNQNINVNFQRLKYLIDEKKITKKSFKLYLNNHDYTRIEPLLKSLKNKDNIIREFDKKMVNACVQKQKSN